ncbi:hypothetical protein FD755_022365 [Muntiacus reevesi]|uniref:Uncharacterized protein n=1 Tax=Muntiacus reevesi TaxID=9886 RepID=A0A5N3VZS4_MUNRE|nr:hypothetical protein FD755_022365 [Muntiacus reevesi]
MWPQGAIFVVLPLLGPTLVWLLIHHPMPNCYASHLVWKDLGGGFGQPLAAAPRSLGCAAHHQLRPAPARALLHLLLLSGLVMRTALPWHPHRQAATLLLLPHLAWLTEAVAITHHL